MKFFCQLFFVKASLCAFIANDVYSFICFEKLFKEIVYELVNMNYRSVIQCNYENFRLTKSINYTEYLKQEGSELKFIREMLDNIFKVDFEFLPCDIWITITSRHKSELLNLVIGLLSKEKIDKKSLTHINTCLCEIMNFLEIMKINDDELEFENRTEYLIDYIYSKKYRDNIDAKKSSTHKKSRLHYSKKIYASLKIEYIEMNQDKLYVTDCVFKIMQPTVKKYTKSNIVFMFQLNYSILFLNHFIKNIYTNKEYTKNIKHATKEMEEYAVRIKKKFQSKLYKHCLKHSSKEQEIILTFIAPSLNYFVIFFRHLKWNYTKNSINLENFLLKINTIIFECNENTKTLINTVNKMNGYAEVIKNYKNMI